MAKILMYNGPIIGKIRCLLGRKQVKKMYREMLDEVTDRYLEYGSNNDYRRLTDVISEVNDVYAQNPMNMYLFLDRERGVIAFGFRDMEMKDIGYYELVG